MSAPAIPLAAVNFRVSRIVSPGCVQNVFRYVVLTSRPTIIRTRSAVVVSDGRTSATAAHRGEP